MDITYTPTQCNHIVPLSQYLILSYSCQQENPVPPTKTTRTKTLNEDVIEDLIQDKLEHIIDINKIIYDRNACLIAQKNQIKAYLDNLTKRLKGIEAYFQISSNRREHYPRDVLYTPITKAFPIMQHNEPSDLAGLERAKMEVIHNQLYYVIQDFPSNFT
ncbi:hypothetical protein ACHQM5_023390 [Ranunculus cassubicifolius]